jgi:hypothetical protein
MIFRPETIRPMYICPILATVKTPADLQMNDPRVRSRTVYWISCTVCGEDADQAAPRFDSEADLWRALLSSDGVGWTRRDDGRILCPAHRGVGICDEDGHVMTLWVMHPLDDELEWRYCETCGARFEQRSRPR